ncbi:uncharacterized protein LOC101779285 [Setaria italica]|uniref:uncharacterized protein LOC101779285 n=1 Tax=Setaria italica TaxID=4555 RepID=UPI0003513460|nr:uncharacterized protein LOC101779285 [Setaria italica]
MQDLRKPSIKVLDSDQVNDASAQALADQNSTNVMMIKAEEDWHAPFMVLITNQMAQEDKIEHEKIARRSANYVVIDEELYRKVASTGILMKYILHSEGLELLHEIYSGTCSNHAALGTLVSNAFRSSFYSPTTVANAKELVQRSKGCQFFSK